MSILDNIGNNLDQQHENHNFLPQKIEIEDLDFGIKNFFEGLNITLMDSSGRQKRVPIIWLNQEHFAQRKNYWEGLVNENGEEITRPFIVISRKGIKQGTAPNKRTIPWMKKFGFTRPRTFDGTLMGYDRYLVRQSTWVDCDYEVRLVTSYMIDTNVFYQDILRDGFSDGQGYMNINGHQIRSVLGEPSEDNQTSSIDDERVFQIIAPVTVYGKLFDPSQFEKRTSIQKISLRVEEKDTSNQGFSRTFGGSASSPSAPSVPTNCAPASIFDYQGNLIQSVQSGSQYNVPPSNVLWSSGGTVIQLAPGQNYQLSASTVLNYAGGTIFNDIEQGQTRIVNPAQVLNSTGETVALLAPDEVFIIPPCQCCKHKNVLVVSKAGLEDANGIYFPDGDITSDITTWTKDDDYEIVYKSEIESWILSERGEVVYLLNNPSSPPEGSSWTSERIIFDPPPISEFFECLPHSIFINENNEGYLDDCQDVNITLKDSFGNEVLPLSVGQTGNTIEIILPI